jgi:hypothetical protein
MEFSLSSGRGGVIFLSMKEIRTFRDFYGYYLREHQTRACRMMHFIGSSLVLLLLILFLLTFEWIILLAIPIVGYGFAWIGHFFFEKNSPATFSYPLYSFLADWVMWKDILTGKIDERS